MNQKAAIGPGASHLTALVQQIHSRTDFIALLHALKSDAQQRPEEWENRDLASFLDAMAAWVEDMEGYYRNRGEPVPSQLSWETFGQILLAASIYE